MRQFGDRGNLAQQAQAVEAPLLDGVSRPSQLRGPSHLTLDLLEELTDLGGCALGRLAYEQCLQSVAFLRVRGAVNGRDVCETLTTGRM